jgi:hypothetical protein
LKKFFVLPVLPSNEKNSFDHHNSYNKGPNLAFFSFTKSHITATHNILQGRANRPFSTRKGASNSIQDPCHIGFVSTLN